MSDSKYILEVNDISKKIHGNKILNNISFQVKPGRILGFLGPNGAGKTTLLRIMTGLMHQTSGSVQINGHDTKKDFENAMKNVGTIIESPEFYNYLSGIQNLRIFADMSRKKISKKELLDTFEFVGLKGSENKKVKGYSLGMRQRLGIANATMHDPKILLLDEPMNGLDPEGIKDFREVLVDFVKKGNSIVISSHILSEIEDIANDLFIINHGNFVYQGTMNDFLSQANKKLVIEVGGEVTKAHDLLNDKGYLVTNRLNRLEINIDKDAPDQRADIAKMIVENDIPLIGMQLSNSSLEDSFLDIIKNDEKEADKK